jgi:hypothetical protein
MFRLALSVLVGIGLLMCGGIAQAGGKKDKPVRGIVQKIDKEDGKEGVVLVIGVVNKNTDVTATTEKQEKRIQVSSSTKIEKVSGKKDNQTRTDMKIDDLKVGQRVVIIGNNSKADKVEVMAGKKNK